MAWRRRADRLKFEWRPAPRRERRRSRARWTGHLLDGRFALVAMVEAHLNAAVHYVGLDPLRAGVAERAEDWTWSGGRARRVGVDDVLVALRPVLYRVDDFAALVAVDHETEKPYLGAA